jgi:hypothetical protein
LLFCKLLIPISLPRLHHVPCPFRLICPFSMILCSIYIPDSAAFGRFNLLPPGPHNPPNEPAAPQGERPLALRHPSFFSCLDRLKLSWHVRPKNCASRRPCALGGSKPRALAQELLFHLARLALWPLVSKRAASGRKAVDLVSLANYQCTGWLASWLLRLRSDVRSWTLVAKRGIEGQNV